MTIKAIRWFLVLWFVAAMALVGVAQSDDPGSAGPGSSPPPSSTAPPTNAAPAGTPDDNASSNTPEPSVARVSLVHGDISMQRGDSPDWVAASINTPLMRGDQVATGENSRVEIQLDFANLLRLSARSQAKVADVTGKHIQVQISQGWANYSMLKGSEAEVEIDTPNLTVRPLRHGRYRVQVNSDSETEVIVREGEADVTTPQGSVTIKEGQLITVRGTDNPEYKVVDAPSRDDWDRWNKDRDSLVRDAEGVRHTNHYYTGTNDLDSYGRWVDVPGYGDVWQPYAQDADWAPYRAGRWVWEPYYGWTWVSYEPWGWAPYHYGRWFYYNSAWLWWPGPVYSFYRPIWSPAFVTFFGFGPRVGFGFGSIGWCPIGPFDPFFPWYGHGFHHHINVVNITNINIINVRNFNGGRVIAPLGVRGRQQVFSNTSLVMTNPHVRAGITSVSSNEFGKGTTTSRQFGATSAQLHDAHVMTANVPVVPTRESLGATRNGASTVQPRTSERFFTKNAPPAAGPSFHDQAARMQQLVETGHVAAGASVSSNAGVSVHGNAGAPVHAGATERIATGAGNSNASNSHDRTGWHSFGNGMPEKSNNSGQAGPAGNGGNNTGNMGKPAGASNTERNDRPGWARFGNNNDSGSSGRPQLQMEKPIVTPRNSEGQGEQHSTTPNNNSRPEMHNDRTPSRTYGNSGGGSNNSGSYGRGSGSYNSGRSSGSSGGSRSTYSGGHSSGSYSGHSSSGSSGGHSSGSSSRSSSGSGKSH